MQETVVVTGAGGYLGNRLVQYLVNQGFFVRALSTNTRHQILHTNIEWCIGDINDNQVLEKLMLGATIVIHCAARKNDESDSYKVNVEGTQKIMQSMHKNAVKQCIYISTQSVKLVRRGVYANTKLAAEQVIKTAPCAYTILRPSILYNEERTGIIGAILSQSRLPYIPIFGNGANTFRPIHLDDMCQVIVDCIQNTKTYNQIYDIGGPTEISFAKLLEQVFASAGLQKRYIRIPNTLSLLMAQSVQILPKPPLTISNVLGAIQSVGMSLDGMQNDIGTVTREFLLPVPIENNFKKEANVLLRYIDPRLTDAAMQELQERYIQACQAHAVMAYSSNTVYIQFPFLLRWYDAYTALCMKQSRLQKKLLIAAAIWESSVYSTDHILPKGSVAMRRVKFCVYCVQAVFILACTILLVPVFYFLCKTNHDI